MRAWARSGRCAGRKPLSCALSCYAEALFRAVARTSTLWADDLTADDALSTCQARAHQFESRPRTQPMAACSRARACEQLRSGARATHLRVGEHGGPQERKSCKRKATSRHHDFQCTISPPNISLSPYCMLTFQSHHSHSYPHVRVRVGACKA